VELATELFRRVASLEARDWVIAAGILSLLVAIALIGRHTGQLIEAMAALQDRVARAEGNLTNADDFARALDEAVAKRMRNLETRQDRLQAKMENLGKDWRDSMRRTEERNSGEFGFTEFDMRKP
jgi:hypothetical protein